MRRIAVLAALLGLTACGGEMLPEEGQVPVSTEEAAASEQVSAESTCSGNSWECFCAQYKTQSSCSTVKSCVWYQNRCQPTYE